MAYKIAFGKLPMALRYIQVPWHRGLGVTTSCSQTDIRTTQLLQDSKRITMTHSLCFIHPSCNLVPIVTMNPAFLSRKRTNHSFVLDDYVVYHETWVLSLAQWLDIRHESGLHESTAACSRCTVSGKSYLHQDYHAKLSSNVITLNWHQSLSHSSKTLSSSFPSLRSSVTQC